MTRNARRHGDGARSKGRTSVVGSTLGEASSRLRARGVPKSGIPTQEGLTIADGALPDSSMGLGVMDARKAGHSILRIVALVSGSLAGLLLVFALVIAILSHTPMFLITSIETNDTEHVTAENVAQLIRLPAGATLLNVDVEAVEKAVLNNPWIASVEVTSAFPDRLLVRTHEREVGALVSMRTGGLCWLMGNDGVWIEPLRVEPDDAKSAVDAALVEANALGVIMISDVPATVSPAAGTKATDETIQAVFSFEEQIPDEFKQRVVSYSAPDSEGISCILESGVEVSLGSPSNVASKVAVATQILDEYAGQVTYVNVRVPSRPTYRRIDSTYVQQGTGATGSAIDEDSKFSTYPQRKVEDEEDDEASESEDMLGYEDEYSSDEYGYTEDEYGYDQL